MTLLLRQLFNSNGLKGSLVNLAAQRGIKRWVAPTRMEMRKRKEKMGPQPISRRSAFVEWNYAAEIYAFGKRLSEDFEEDLLKQALTHKSYLDVEIERQKEVGIEDGHLTLKDNTGLIEEGEKFMTYYIKGYLRIMLPQFPEEGICAVHDYLMTNEVLAHVSSHIGTKDILLCAEYPPSEKTLANTIKAIVGALLKGEENKEEAQSTAGGLVHDLVITQLAGRDLNELWVGLGGNAIATLAAILHRDGRGPPEPRLLYEAGPSTILASYAVGIYSDKELVGCECHFTICQKTVAMNHGLRNGSTREPFYNKPASMK
ncbi:39S ribosomal protein L44, mitochondrial isoform X2 [Ischnura elegans]|uniref:39S ribosomal protein L44, mitochondrial isoform X2 n=1 Tax=Ischnura elegans TaxID=197161 RepID=UPI001ED870D5|nr:39S ribosomal protein L44, mitochondrial isoform X2 [Ischnura elegans]